MIILTDLENCSSQRAILVSSLFRVLQLTVCTKTAGNIWAILTILHRLCIYAINLHTWVAYCANQSARCIMERKSVAHIQLWRNNHSPTPYRDRILQIFINENENFSICVLKIIGVALLNHNNIDLPWRRSRLYHPLWNQILPAPSAWAIFDFRSGNIVWYLLKGESILYYYLHILCSNRQRIVATRWVSPGSAPQRTSQSLVATPCSSTWTLTLCPSEWCWPEWGWSMMNSWG